MKNKLSSDYSLICQQRRDIEFAQEYSRIIDIENQKISSAFRQLSEDINVQNLKSDKISSYLIQISDVQARIKEEKNSLAQKANKEFEYSAKETYHHQKILEDENGEYDGFKTANKATDTLDMNEESTVNVQFQTVVRKKEVAHKKLQITLQKQPTRDQEVQVSTVSVQRLSKLQSSDNESIVEQSHYQNRMIDRLKVERMIVQPAN